MDEYDRISFSKDVFGISFERSEWRSERKYYFHRLKTVFILSANRMGIHYE